MHLERRVPRRLLLGRAPDVMTRAHHVFRRLGMHRTAERHGVLVYLAVEDRRLAVVGDEGIHGRVGDPHWHRVRDRDARRGSRRTRRARRSSARSKSSAARSPSTIRAGPTTGTS